MKISAEEQLDLAQYGFLRLDGAWFIALAKNHGIQVAWDADVDAWRQLALLIGKRIRKKYITGPVWPESFIEMLDLFCDVFRIKGREITLHADHITVKVTDCDTQKAIAKAGIADCGIVTEVIYKSLANGLFNKEMDITIEHVKNLNHGDPWCEHVITARPGDIVD